MLARFVAAALLASLSAGCSTISAIEVGPTTAFATRREPQVGAQAEARAGVGWSDRMAAKTWGMEASSKVKLTSATQNFALGDGFYLARSTPKGDLTALVRGGFHLVFERYAEKVLVGGGPYAALMIGIPLSSRDYMNTMGELFMASMWRSRTLLTIGPALELDARFSRPSAVTFFGIAIGLAWTDDNLRLEPALPGVLPKLKPNDPANTPPPY